MKSVFSPSADLARLRSQLVCAGYSTESVRAHIDLDESVESLLANTGRHSLFFLEKLAHLDSESAVLGQLFLFGGTASADRLHQLDRELIDLLWSLGLIEPTGHSPGVVVGTVALTEYQGLYFLSDRLFENREGDIVINEQLDYCMPLHASSLELLAAVEQSAGVEAMLDMGCGSGCQSLLLARDYDYVTGIDVNPRSVKFARANAFLNELHINYSVGECRSYRDERLYDHVTFNSPDSITGFAFINSSLAQLLKPTGTAQVWASCEITEVDQDLEGMIRNNLDEDRLRVAVSVNANSPFSLNSRSIQRRRLPYGTLLVDHPSKQEAYFDDLVARRVLEVVSVVFTLAVRGN